MANAEEEDRRGWTDIETIEFRFGPHCTNKNVHNFLNESLSDSLEADEINELFETNERLELKSNAIETLRGIIDSYITINAKSTKDLTRIPIITRDLPLITETIRHDRGTTSKSTNKITNPRRLLRALNEVREEGGDKLVLKFVTHTLQFYEGKGFNPANFAHIGNEDNPPELPTKEETSPKSETQDDILNAILTGNATLARTLDTLVNNQSPSPNRRDFQRSEVRQAADLNPDLFNINSLPPDVRDRCELAKRKERMVTRSDMKPFITDVPNITYDSTGNTMRTCLYHQVYPGNRIILRDGTQFRLNTETKIDKMFVQRAPKLPRGKLTPENIRCWYKLLLEHCQNFGVFLCPYYCFRKNVGDLKGFVCGEDTDINQYDLPNRYSYAIPKWTGLIGQAIKEAFPEGSTQRGICETNETDGYKAVRRILRSHHPSTFLEYGATLAMDHPIQEKDMDIHEYYDIYTDYLERRAFIDDIPTSLHDYDQMTKFIVSCKWGYRILNMESVRNDRKSSEATIRDRYSPSEIALTIQDLLAFVDTERLPPFENMRKVRKLSSPAASPVRPMRDQRANGQRGRQNQQRDVRKPSNKTPINKKVNMIGMEKDMEELEASIEGLKVDDRETDRFAVGIYRIGINAVKTTGAFDTSQNCLVCSAKGHTFEDCPVLNNHELLKDIHIAFCACCKRIQRKSEQANQPVFKIESDANYESDSDYEYQHMTGYDESDFVTGKG